MELAHKRINTIPIRSGDIIRDESFAVLVFFVFSGVCAKLYLRYQAYIFKWFKYAWLGKEIDYENLKLRNDSKPKRNEVYVCACWYS